VSYGNGIGYQFFFLATVFLNELDRRATDYIKKTDEAQTRQKIKKIQLWLVGL
jgi:hypothetical protein